MYWLNAKSLCVSLANVSNKSIFTTRTEIANRTAKRFDVCGKVSLEWPIIFPAPGAVIASKIFLFLLLLTTGKGRWVSDRCSGSLWVMVLLKRQSGVWHPSGCNVDQISVGFPVDSLNHRLSNPWQIVGRFSKKKKDLKFKILYDRMG